MIPNTLFPLLLIIITLLTSLHQLSQSSAVPASSTDFENAEYVTLPVQPPLSDIASNATIQKLSISLCSNCDERQIEYLFGHNVVRAKKGLHPLAWDGKVLAYAKKYMERRRHDCEMVHSKPPMEFDVGENLYWGTGKDWKPMDAVNAWADEERFYDYEANTCAAGEMCGHYTQMVWNTTEKLGCADVVCDTGDMLMSCNYYPPGNYVDERPY